MKQLRYMIEGAVLWIFTQFFRLLPAPQASAIGGWIGRTIGPRMAASRKAKRNLANAMPELSESRRDEIITQMWDNLGRVMAEYPHLETLARDYARFDDPEKLKKYLNDPHGTVLIAAHLANWEINAAAALVHCDKALNLAYRAPNNPWSDRMLMKHRTLNGKLGAFPKSRKGGHNMLETVKSGGQLGILIDQKYNQGVSVPFFGIPAMTNPFFVQVAQKYKCPLVPVQATRVKGCHFHLIVHDPLSLFEADGSPRPVIDVVADAHKLMEEWIADNPGQWLWLHRRWPDSEIDKDQTA